MVNTHANGEILFAIAVDFEYLFNGNLLNDQLMCPNSIKNNVFVWQREKTIEITKIFASANPLCSITKRIQSKIRLFDCFFNLGNVNQIQVFLFTKKLRTCNIILASLKKLIYLHFNM